MKSPAFQWYPADYLGSQRVQLLTLEEEGAYRRLLDYCWLHGSIPADISLLSRLIGKGASTTLATTVSTMFQPRGDRLVHDRLDAERRKQEQWREKSAKGGRKGAATRAKRGLQKPAEQHHDNGSLPNGINQKPTLLSSVFCLPSSSSDTPIPELPVPKRVEKTLLQLRAEKLFRRRESTVWDKSETKAWSANLTAIQATTDEEWATLEQFYARPASEATYRRRDLATLLNNWRAEIDRAAEYLARTPTPAGPKQRITVPRRYTPEECLPSP